MIVKRVLLYRFIPSIISVIVKRHRLVSVEFTDTIDINTKKQIHKNETTQSTIVRYGRCSVSR